MSASSATARPRRRVAQDSLLRQLQQAIAVARAIRIAAEYPSDGLDLADAVAGLVIVLEGATALLDQPGGVP